MTKARELSDYTGLQGDLALKSTVASPSFTGTVTADGLVVDGNDALVVLRDTAVDSAYSATLRLSEDPTSWLGGYIRYAGNTNVLHIGTHGAQNELVANDLDAISIARDSGNVGIGVTPESTWHDTHTVLQLGDRGALLDDAGGVTMMSNSYYDSGWKYLNTDLATMYESKSGKHNFLVAPSGSADSAISWTGAMTINNDGDVYSNPAVSYNNSAVGWNFSKSEGDARFTGNNGNTVMWVNQTFADSSSRGQIWFYRNEVKVGAINSNSSSTSYSTSSDYRLKTDVQPMTGATDRVKLLKPCNFEWIADGTRVDGFIAHEAQEVVPESVTGTKDAMMDEEYEVTPAVVDDEGNETTAAVMGTRSVPDMQGIDQAKLVPLLTATIQELIARIEALEGE
jgi:hypothetical protein